MKARYVPLVCVIAVLLFLVVIPLYVRSKSVRAVVPPADESVVKTKTHSTPVGAGMMSEKLFLQTSDLGQISDILVWKSDPKQEAEFGVAGANGAVFVDAGGRTAKSIRFNGSFNHVNIIDVEGDGAPEFLNRGDWTSNTALIDSNGKTKWTFGDGSQGVDDSCAGDINGDGKLEFVVGFNGGGGVSLLDSSGKQQWNEPDGNVWHVEIADVNQDGKQEIVHSNAGGEMILRDTAGGILQQQQTGTYFCDFALIDWAGKKNQQSTLSSVQGSLMIIGFDGKVIERLDAPNAGEFGTARGTLAKLDGKGNYLAVVVSYRARGGSGIYVYDPSKKLIYQQLTPQLCEAIAAAPLEDSGVESLLIGIGNKVMRYDLKRSAP